MRHIKLRTTHAVIAGLRHAAVGHGCDDYCVAIAKHNTYAVAALADGAGSAANGGEGARLAIDTVTRAACDGQRGAQELCLQAAEVLRFHANSIGASPASLSTTLLVAVLEISRSGCVLNVAHVGDGAIVAVDGNHAWTASGPDRGEFANETVFLTSAALETRLRSSCLSLSKDAGVLLMSDGPMECLYDKRTGKPADACKTIVDWGRRNTPRRFTRAVQRSLVDVIGKRTHDDCSLACITTAWT
jgi:serine/threonine protein phosphatase PrpC